MPTYDFKCSSCGKESVVVCKMSELDEQKKVPCDACGGELRVVIGEPRFGDAARLGLMKNDDGFKEVLAKIHENTAGSNLNAKLSR